MLNLKGTLRESWNVTRDKGKSKPEVTSSRLPAAQAGASDSTIQACPKRSPLCRPLKVANFPKSAFVPFSNGISQRTEVLWPSGGRPGDLKVRPAKGFQVGGKRHNEVDKSEQVAMGVGRTGAETG